MATRFDPAWLASRRTFDDAALDRPAIQEIREWAARQEIGRPLRVVDLGSGSGAALRRAVGWLGERRVEAFAVDLDPLVLSAVPRQLGRDVGVVAVVADALGPLFPWGGPPDDSVDLVLAHALADLLPLDVLAERVHALLRPGGVAHLALTYDGATRFEPAEDDDLEARMVAAYHRHMDRPRARCPTLGGSTAGRRLARALESAGLTILRQAPSPWHIRVMPGDGAQAREVLRHMLRFVVESVSEVDALPPNDVRRWAASKWALLERGRLSLRVRHVDVLAVRGSF